MSLTVPPGHIAVLKKWLELPTEEATKFSSALEGAKAQFNGPELAKSIVPTCALSPALIYSIVEVLINVYRAGEPQKPFETFLDGSVKPALVHAKTFSEGKEEEEWGRLRQFLLHALSLEGILGTTAKAGEILTGHEKIFETARVMTDFRPIFHVDVSEKPDAGLVIHMLKITQRDKHSRKFDTYYALDTNDIEKLMGVLDRAVKKEKALRKMMEDAGLRVLDVKAFY